MRLGIARFRRFIERRIARSYLATKLFVHLMTTARLLRNHRTMLVYTMGKVGSSTVASTLAKACPNTDIYHLHWLTEHNLRADDSLNRGYIESHRRDKDSNAFRASYIWEAQILRRAIQGQLPAKRKWEIVSLVREPVSRNVAAFFQNLSLFFGYELDSEIERLGEAKVTEELIKLFLEHYGGKSDKIAMDADPLTWFDDEIRPVFGIDVFSSEFPHDPGYQVIENDRCRLLLIRLEDLQASHIALAEFVGVNGLSLNNQNVGSAKRYQSVYSRFKREFRAPAWYLERLYSSRYARHFYTPAEIDSFRLQWTGETGV